MDDFESLSHSKWDCKYHVVFIPKGRRKVLYGKLRQHDVADAEDTLQEPVSRNAESERCADLRLRSTTLRERQGECVGCWS
jgi:putative transposase